MLLTVALDAASPPPGLRSTHGAFVGEGGVATVLRALKAHRANEAVQEQGLRALANLWHAGSAAHRDALRAAGLQKLLVGIKGKSAPSSHVFDLSVQLLDAVKGSD